MQRRIEKRGTNGRRQPKALPNGQHAYVIRIAKESDQERALVAFRSVGEAVHSIAEDEFLVAADHVEALLKAGIPFEDVTEAQGKHGETEAGLTKV